MGRQYHKKVIPCQINRYILCNINERTWFLTNMLMHACTYIHTQYINSSLCRRINVWRFQHDAKVSFRNEGFMKVQTRRKWQEGECLYIILNSGSGDQMLINHCSNSQ